MLDALQILSNAQVLTVTAPSSNVWDEGVAMDFGAGDKLGIHVTVGAAFTAAGSATLDIAWQGSTDNNTFYDMLKSATIAVAALTAGVSVFRVEVPPRQLNMPSSAPARYFRLNYTVSTGPMLTGTISAWLAAISDRSEFYAYPRAYAVS